MVTPAATAVAAVHVAARAVAGAIGVRSLTQTRPARAPMSNGPIDVGMTSNRGLRVLTPDGPGAVAYRCDGTCTSFTWSPDGTRLAYLGGSFSWNDDLHVADPADGTDRIVASGGPLSDPAWSPDGSRIAFVDGSLHFPRLLVVEAVGQDASPKVLFSTGGSGDIASLSWSPDGSRISYDDSGQRFVVGSNGGAPSPTGPSGLRAGTQYPTWSPDGRAVAYFSRTGCEVRSTTPDGHDVLLADLDTLTDRCSYGGGLAWSPDGTQLAAYLWQEITPRHYFAAVYLVDADGSGARPLTGWIEDPQWWGLAWQPVP